MRDDQSLLFDHPVPIQNQIEVHGAGRARTGAFAPEISLDREKQIEQRTRRQGCPSHGSGVEKPGLVAHIHRCGVVEGGNAKVVDRTLQRLEGVEEVAIAVAKIAAEGDRNRNQRYSIQRLGSTAPALGTPPVRRPSRFSSPPAACANKRRCSSDSPMTTLSIVR